MAKFHSSLWLSKIPLYICVCMYVCMYIYIYTHIPNLLNLSSFNEPLGCFHVLAIVNSAAKKHWGNISF